MKEYNMQDYLDKHPRCEVRETTARMERQCVRDLNHTGKCEFGSWRNK